MIYMVIVGEIFKVLNISLGVKISKGQSGLMIQSSK